jgi:arylformamidase
VNDHEFLDREYNPRVRILQFGDFFARWKADAQRSRDLLNGRLSVAYGTAAAETLDFFAAAPRGPLAPRGSAGRNGAADQSGAPLLIFIHGGYWRALDKADFSWVAPPYVASGIAVAVLNYGLAPGTPVPEIVEQVRRACAWLHDNAASLQIDRNRIYCCGHSAGGHLTAMMLATDWTSISKDLPRRLIAGALAISGLFDLQPLTHAEFLRKDLNLDETAARGISPAFLPLQNQAPLLRAVGALETAEFHRQSELIAAHWPGACPTELMDVPDCNHFSVCEALGTPGNMLFESWRAAILEDAPR